MVTKVAVLGPAGFGGSYVVNELLNRGSYDVVGISRNPGKIGKHDRYTPHALDITNATIAELIEAFKSVDVVINAFNPPYGPNVYKTFVETVRRIVIAAKHSNLQYFLTIGGTSSLYLRDPATSYETAADSRPFWLAYRRATADSEAATYHMEERIGFGSPMSRSMRAYRSARQSLLSNPGSLTAANRKVIDETEKMVTEGPDPIPDIPIAARATYMFFEGNTTFPWSFVSPPAKYIPGPRTAKYEVHIDRVPLAPESERTKGSENEFDGRLLGISVADLAVAIVDEVEKREKIGKHWSAVAELPGEHERHASYARLS
ncbi:hypothetical protein LTR91_018798 [Friedmanniomyces endolithicus]|uniref:NAD-dependent epimerase/dehydratase domain-containing protein n=1 Tax=Friedmanniomyces endolithicus TaxID=329885 RepID=A0AAN6HEU6_9PEZI|nr:hypothetical protein LTR94_018508 [Friedmanniomyces endolithicus]KAK0777038.1 hypothetical protein LTR59_013990 [Friedmanniomyces endolithicus]KAK0780048.1 hypothetical protein LTR38_014215 [Friedmanniomyces endolithicus]KAK0788296.1 hypothetical protein LTR75_012638 [Friedmanniomyces endolithicus]KAK0832729.1 hypothetical protein LTR03_014972 [Friedmanniomyces endolithicus]